MKELDIEKLIEGLKSLGKCWEEKEPGVSDVDSAIDERIGGAIFGISEEIKRAYKEVKP